MVIVPRIVVAPTYGATPVVCGVRQGDRLRAGSVVSFAAAVFSPHWFDSVRPSSVFAWHERRIDTLFGNQKDKVSKKYWDAGLKAALRTNPG